LIDYAGAGLRSGCQLNFAVVVAVAVVGMVEVAVHQVVRVVAVRDSFVTAVGAVHMARLVSAAVVLGRALVGVTPAGADLMIVDMISV
jgi:hypothetical protein